MTITVFRLLATGSLFSVVSYGGGPERPDASPPVGRSVISRLFETYTAQHNGYQRVRTTDAVVSTDTKDTDPCGRAGYRKLIALAGEYYIGSSRLKLLLRLIAQLVRRRDFLTDR